MNHSDVRDMLGVHALGALEAREAEAIEAHLDHCDACLAELVELEEAAAELVGAVPPLTPSPDVTRRILDAAPSESPRRVVGPAGADARGRWRPSFPRGGRRRDVRTLRVAAGIAVAAVLVALVVSQVSLYQRLERASAMLAHGRELLEFMSSPDVVTVALAAAESMPDARALVSYDRRSGRVVVLASGLPAAPPGEVYQLWLIADGVRPGGVFSPDRRGGTVLHARWSPEPGDALLFAVTLEPSPGMPYPTGKNILLGGSARSGPAGAGR
jgi:anti-sigma-K factor RskA